MVPNFVISTFLLCSIRINTDMNLEHIIIIVLSAIILSTLIIYFILANNEYSSLLEFAAVGLDGEIHELQIEIALFAGSALIYLGLLAWILIKKLNNILPYAILIGVSTALIITYALSRTTGVPIVGIEFYIGKYDIATKILQGVIVVISGYLIYKIKTSNEPVKIMKKT